MFCSHDSSLVLMRAFFSFFFCTAPKSDPVARKLRLRRRRDGQESEKVLKVGDKFNSLMGFHIGMFSTQTWHGLCDGSVDSVGIGVL